MLQPNQISQVFQSKLGRPSTDFENTTYANSNIQDLANIKDTYSALNKDSSITDYLKYNGMDSSADARTALGTKYGINNIGTPEGNTALLKTLQGGQKPPTVPVTPITGTVTQPVVKAGTDQSNTTGNTAPEGVPNADPNNPNKNNPILGNTDITNDEQLNIGATKSTDGTAQPTDLQSALDTYQAAQKSVSDIDTQVATLRNTMAQTVNDIKAESAKSGAFITESEAQQVASERNAGITAQINSLMSQRAQYVTSQTAAQKNLQFYQSQEKIDNQQEQFGEKQDLSESQLQEKATNATALATLKAQLSGSNQDVSPALAAAIENGTVDPTKISSRSIKIYNDLASMGVDAVGSSLTAKQRADIVNQATQYQTQAKLSSGVLEQNMPILIQLAPLVNQGDVPGINAAWLSGKAYTSSDPNVTKYASILETLRSEYSNLLTKGATGSDQTRQDAANAIPAGLTADQYTQLEAQLQTEAQNIVGTAQQTIDSAQNNTQNDSSNPTPNTLPAGTVIQDGSGKSYTVGADGQTLIPN